MKLSVQIVVHPDDGQAEPVVREVFALDRDALAPDTLGLRLAEAQDLLAAVQDSVVDQQVQRAIQTQVPCPYCGRARRHKDTRSIVVRSLFGVLRLASPRWWHCDCCAQPTRTFQPLAGLLPERTTPELAYLQARFAGWVSYGITAKLLGELLPLGRKLHPAVVRRQTQAVAARLEDELGEEQFSFIDTCQADREELPHPDLPLTVGLDGGYVHSAAQRSRRDGWFEIIAGKVVPAEGRASCFGYVQTYDTKPKRRLFEVLKAHGMAANQQVTFLTDGGEDIRDVPCYLNAHAEHLLDWFHITIRITVMTNMAKSLQPPPADPELELTAEATAKLVADVRADLERLKWFLWHGNVFRALQTVTDITTDLETLHPGNQPCKLLTAVREFDSYLRANAERIPNYGERRRVGEAISTAFTESTVNQVISKRMVKKQTDALDPTRRPPPPSDSHPRPQRPTCRRLPPMAPRLQPKTPHRSIDRGIAPPNDPALQEDTGQQMSEPPFDPTASRTLWTIMGMTRPHDEVYTNPRIVACTQQILQHQDRTQPRYLVRNP